METGPAIEVINEMVVKPALNLFTKQDEIAPLKKHR